MAEGAVYSMEQVRLSDWYMSDFDRTAAEPQLAAPDPNVYTTLMQAMQRLNVEIEQMKQHNTSDQLIHNELIMDYIEDADENFSDDDMYGIYGYHDNGPYQSPELYARGAHDENEPMRRAPRHRVAFDPATFGARTGGPPTAAARQNPAGQSMPQQRTPFPVQGSGPPPTGPNRTPSHLRPPAPQRVSRDSNDPSQRADTVPLLSADILAESKGRELALKACRSLSVDASREANLVIPAAEPMCCRHPSQ